MPLHFSLQECLWGLQNVYCVGSGFKTLKENMAAVLFPVKLGTAEQRLSTMGQVK